jgi:hypothetical protein
MRIVDIDMVTPRMTVGLAIKKAGGYAPACDLQEDAALT